MAQPVPVLLSGFGKWVRERTVIPLLAQTPDLIKVAVVTSIDEQEFEEEVRPRFRKQPWGMPEFVPNFDQACDRMSSRGESPVAVLVTTPNALHFQEARRAIEKGYHVYVERPVVTREDPLPTLIQLANRQRVWFFTGTQRRLEDPFQYVHRILAEGYQFGNLRRLYCRLAAGHRLNSWRRDASASGGGIVTDTGYHLLDLAAWLLQAVGVEVPEHMEGAVHFGFDEPKTPAPAPVETGAVGYLKLPQDILLSFDFTYNAPEESIYEQMELYDDNSARVSVTRDQPVRTPLPGTVSHQLGDGRFVSLETSRQQGIQMDAIRFAGTAQNA